MKKYEELAKTLNLDPFLEGTDLDYTEFYLKVNDLLKTIQGSYPAEAIAKAKAELFTQASCVIHVGSNLDNFRKTKEILKSDGIWEDRIPSVMTGASLCYLVDRTVATMPTEGIDNSKIQSLCLEKFLDMADMKYLGIAA